MKRGDIVLVALGGDYGKPRPALIVQDDRLTVSGTCGSVVVCPITSDLSNAQSFRVRVDPTPRNGLEKPSNVMVEKLAGARATRLRQVIGSVDDAVMHEVEQALLLVLGFSQQT